LHSVGSDHGNDLVVHRHRGSNADDKQAEVFDNIEGAAEEAAQAVEGV
jgi:hypothetical protein